MWIGSIAIDQLAAREGRGGVRKRIGEAACCVAGGGGAHIGAIILVFILRQLVERERERTSVKAK